MIFEAGKIKFYKKFILSIVLGISLLSGYSFCQNAQTLNKPEDFQSPWQDSFVNTKQPSEDINVADYEKFVSNDGDWSLAITQAENEAASRGKNVFFPGGEYKLTNYLMKKNHVNWSGEGTKSVIYFGDDFHSDDTKKEDSNYIIVTEHQNAKTPDSFSLRNMTFAHRQTKASTYEISGLFLMSYTDGVTLENLNIDYYNKKNARKTRIFDFKAANSNTTIRGCNITGSNGGIGFRNFSETACSNLLIENNTIVRSEGSVDEGIWICANVGPIVGVTIRGNSIATTGNGVLASAIYVSQADAYTSLKNNVIKDVSITNNQINCQAVMYYGINVGTYISGFPQIKNVTIADNRIQAAGIKKYTSSGICCQNVEQSEIRNNVIKGAFNGFITGGKYVVGNTIVEDHNTQQIETTGLAYCECARNNSVTVSQIGFKNCSQLIQNIITAPTNYLHTAKEYNFTGNKFVRNGTRGSAVIGAYLNNTDGIHSKPVVTLTDNTFSCAGKPVLKGDMQLSMKNNYAENTSTFINGDSDGLLYAENNTYVTPEGEVKRWKEKIKGQ